MIHSAMHRLHNPDLAIFLIRIALGVVFIFHGNQKLGAMEQTIGFFDKLGIPAYLAYVVAWAEFLGGILLIAGLFVRYVGIVLTIVMAVAILTVHLENGFSLSKGGYEFALVLMLGSLALACSGAGRYSIAAAIKHPAICEGCEIGPPRQ